MVQSLETIWIHVQQASAWGVLSAYYRRVIIEDYSDNPERIMQGQVRPYRTEISEI